MLIAVLILPVSGAETTGDASGNEAPVSAVPYISATATPAKATIGEPVTISGVATGGNLTSGVQIWVFAGNYVNVSTVPVTSDGTYSAVYQTTGLPAALYYVIVQSPGKDGSLNILMETTGQFSGQVMNTMTGKPVFTFTGTGSVQDSAAAQALSDAFNQSGVDDIYSKCTFQLVAAGTAAPASTPALPAPVTTTKKSPVTLVTVIAAISLLGIAVVQRSRK
ncbi:hypothetical protein [Methanoregula sp.]|uniref:hypothetical protein n=1 Tax=Methanoregula sp. TaxID=2052170 RepID=UPI002612A0DD|nr:hypothetical protein [Methanoregula sp.]MDD5143173.1 hypothetical protein [Methanoregula sp.]